MKRFFSVVALSVALGLSTMGFRNADNKVTDDCEEARDLTVTATLEELAGESGELKGMIVNKSSDNDYDDVVVRVDFYGDAATAEDEMESFDDMEADDMKVDDMEVDEMDTPDDVDSPETMDDSGIDTDRDVDLNVSDDEVEMEYETEAELKDKSNKESGMEAGDNTSLELDENSLGSRVITIDEDVEAGEVEEFALDIAPPAGTTRIVTSVVCAD